MFRIFAFRPAFRLWVLSNFVVLIAITQLGAQLSRSEGAEESNAQVPIFRVSFTAEVHPEPYSGRVYLFFSQTPRPPRFGPDWFSPEPFVARDVTDWKPGEPLLFDAAHEQEILAFPRPLSQLQLGGHRVQAVARFNPLARDVGTGAGNGFSGVQQVSLQQPGEEREVVELTINLVQEPRPFDETPSVRLLRVRSKLLSEFQGRDVYLQASVELPASYGSHPDARYPTIFEIPGFGGTHHRGQGHQAALSPKVDEKQVEFLYVTLDPSSPWGHHVFADSATNGPVGEALVTELIPRFDKQFRSMAEPAARFVTGHSSGGWSSLWLQVTYPSFFGGVWSTAPDPVDLRDFQQINIYAEGANVYRDEARELRPLVRRGDQVVVYFRQFARMESVLGRGGQLRSFEAVFSPQDEDGQPRKLWDRETGAVDPEVARAWEKYDIRKILQRNWEQLAPELAGKIHVYMGEQDTFYLDGATRKLKQTLQQLGSDAVIELLPGRNHFNLISRDLARTIRQDMVDTFLASYPNYLQQK